MQQYTCPKCFEDYFTETAYLHYGCGVKPDEDRKDAEKTEESNQIQESEAQKDIVNNPVQKKRGRPAKIKQ